MFGQKQNVNPGHIMRGLKTIARDTKREMTLFGPKLKLMRFLNGCIRDEANLIRTQIMPEYNKAVNEIKQISTDFGRFKRGVPGAGLSSPAGRLAQDAGKAKLYNISYTRLSNKKYHDILALQLRTLRQLEADIQTELKESTAVMRDAGKL